MTPAAFEHVRVPRMGGFRWCAAGLIPTRTSAETAGPLRPLQPSNAEKTACRKLRRAKREATRRATSCRRAALLGAEWDSFAPRRRAAARSEDAEPEDSSRDARSAAATTEFYGEWAAKRHGRARDAEQRPRDAHARKPHRSEILPTPSAGTASSTRSATGGKRPPARAALASARDATTQLGVRKRRRRSSLVAGSRALGPMNTPALPATSGPDICGSGFRPGDRLSELV